MSSESAAGARWGIVLAGGDGERLRALTATVAGPVPKQYCSLRGGPSLLRMALLRARSVVRPARVAVVVAAAHRQWWSRELADLPAANVVVQPANRGTAAGILLPLLSILARDPRAVVAILPSDHWFEQERVLHEALRQAFAEARRRASIVLLGIRPERVEPDLGWILPGGPPAAARQVTAFQEKPGRDEAGRLLAAGGLLSSFLFVARAEVLLRLFATLLPEVTEPLLAWHEKRQPAELSGVYQRLPRRDFSQHLLQRARESLTVIATPACGWSDLGTPERVERCVASAGRAGARGGRLGGTTATATVHLADRLTAQPATHSADVG